MDEQRFDDFTRALAEHSARRMVLPRVLGGGALTIVGLGTT